MHAVTPVIRLPISRFWVNRKKKYLGRFRLIKWVLKRVWPLLEGRETGNLRKPTEGGHVTRTWTTPLGNESRPWLAAGTGTLVSRQQGSLLANRDLHHTISRKWILPVLANLERGLKLQLEITALEGTLTSPWWDLKKRAPEIINGYRFKPLNSR